MIRRNDGMSYKIAGAEGFTKSRMNGKAVGIAWVTALIIVATTLSVMGGLAAAAPVCPCWDIEEVRQEVLDSEFPCQTREEVKVRNKEARITGAAAQCLPPLPCRGQNFSLEALILKVKHNPNVAEKRQVSCRCFSNPLIEGCVGGELKGIEHEAGQACVRDLNKLCKDVRRNR
jgi:hypothetical protein